MNIILFEDNSWESLLPLTFARPVADLRIGILKISEKWKFYFNEIHGYHTRSYLSSKYPIHTGTDNLLINGSILPEDNLAGSLKSLKPMQALIKEDKFIAVRFGKTALDEFNPLYRENYELIQYKGDIDYINHPWHLFEKNGKEIIRDYGIITKTCKSNKLSGSNNIISPENVFVEEGVQAEYITINASKGPVYIGKNTELMEGSVIRGPFAICEGSLLKLSAKIYGPTTIGPYCQAGGEIKNSILQAYSNKSHDGYLGNSVVGEWCNIGADTNCSNLKNNYTEVKLWSYKEERFIPTGLQFCGLIMGDHSKCSINTMFNTGTVVGMSANIFGTGFPRNFIPSFSWGGSQGFSTYSLDKALETAKIAMSMKNVLFDKKDKEIFESVFTITEKYRR